MAKLRKRKNGTYFVDYCINGRRFRKTAGKSKKIAELYLKDIEVKIAKGEIGFTTKDQTLVKLFEEFLKYGSTNHAPSTQKRYSGIIRNLESFLGHHPYLSKISQLTPKIFEDYKAYRKGQSAKPKTINIELQTIRAMFYLAIKWGYCKDNPTKGVSMLKEDNHIKPRYLTKEEIKKFLDGCSEWEYPIFYTFIHTGMRKGEIENLEWDDVDFERRRIKVGVKDGWRPKTTEREIPLHSALLELLKQHRKKAKNISLVFHKKGQKIEPNSLRKKLIRIAKKTGIKDLTKLHTLRHTFASQLAMSGVRIQSIKEMLGHVDIDTTMIYSHLSDDHLDQEIEKLEF